MNGRKLTLTISGREALPVRAIPYIAEWKEVKASPGWIDWIADHLAQGKKAPRGTTPLTAYKWLKDKSPVTVSPSDWKLTVESLRARVASLGKKTNELPTPTTSFIVAAKLESLVDALPRGAFVWLDEFKVPYHNHRERNPLGRVTLNITPTACDNFNTRALVLFGFEEHEDYADNQPTESMKGSGKAFLDERKRPQKIDIDYWLARSGLSAREAAMLLCQFSPFDETCETGGTNDPDKTATDETGPEDFKRLLRAFEESAPVEKKIRLCEWHTIAKNEGQKHHSWIDRHMIAPPMPDKEVGAGETAAKEAKLKQDTDMPWLIPDPTDPAPEQSWYVPARYFARQLVKDDSTLLTKRRLLAEKVVQSLKSVGIKKRGGTKSFELGTVLKAFSNVNLG
jgi:hypothetical protein